MPTLVQVKTHEEFYTWIRNKLQEKQRQGQNVVFPSINRFHIDMEDSESESDTETQSLGKRYSKLLQEKNEVEEKVRRLSTENQVLLASSKDWMLKYIQLSQANYAEEESDYFWTPIKPG